MCGNEPCRHDRADAITSLVASANATAKALAERDVALAALADLRATIAADIRAWSEARTAERVPQLCEDADEGYCHHDGAFTAYALAARIAEGKL